MINKHRLSPIQPITNDQVRLALLTKMATDLLKVHHDFMAKVDEFKQILDKKAPKGEKGDPGRTPTKSEVVNVITSLITRELIESIVIPRIIPPKDGKDAVVTDAHLEEIANRVIGKLNIRNGKDAEITDELVETVAKKAAEKIKVDPVDPLVVIDQIMNLPREKRPKFDFIDGYEQTIHSIFNQLARGYLHGAGGNGATNVYGEVPSGSGTVFTLTYTPVGGKISLYRGGARQIVGASNDYTLSGKTITLSVDLGTGETLLADYSYNA